MRAVRRLMITLSAALPFLALTSIDVIAQEADAETLYREGTLREKSNYDASDDADRAYGYTRQGFAHIRQGNTSTDQDPMGRSHNPYGGENLEQIHDKVHDRYLSPEWRLGIDMMEPRRIVIDRGDKTEEYWYILYRVINDNFRDVIEEGTKGAIEDLFSSNLPESGIDRTVRSAEGRYVGMPVSTNISFHVELLSIDALANPESSSDDLLKAVNDEASRIIGNDIGAETSSGANTEKAERLAAERYKAARYSVADEADPYVLQKISEREGLWEWNGAKRESILWPSSAFKRDLSYVYNVNQPRLDGPRCLPRRLVAVANDGKILERMVYPGVFTNDNSYAGHFEEGDARLTELTSSGIRLVTSMDDPMWGKLTTVRYQAGHVVDRFGASLTPDMPGYHSARMAGGEIVKSVSDLGIEGNLENLIGEMAMRPSIRTYKDGDRVLFGWDTGVERDDAPNQNYTVSGLIVHANDQENAASALAHRRKTTRSLFQNEEVGPEFIRAANANRYETARELDGGFSIGYQTVVGQPVKQLDHLGRAIRTLVTYEAGDMVTETEYRIYAAYYPTDVVAAHPDDCWTRPLNHNDLLVGLPKIKMGRLNDASLMQPERIQRMVEEGTAGRAPVFQENYFTGRVYDPSNEELTPDAFWRDADGSFFTDREAPLPPNVQLSDAEQYMYAPLGPARDGAVPVPKFDSSGVWDDFRDAETGMRVPLRDRNGDVVRNKYGVIQYAKAFEYEWQYTYVYEPEEERDATFQRASEETIGALQTEEVSFMRGADGKLIGPAVYRIMGKQQAVDPTNTANTIQVDVLKRLSLSDDAGAGETAIAPDPATMPEGVSLVNVSLPKYVADGIRSAMQGSVSSRAISASDFESAQQVTGGIDMQGILRTYDRWTLPPPYVYTGADGKPVVETRLNVQIGPGRTANGSDAPRALVKYISERWGAFVFKAPDAAWDYANVEIRGLRSGITRKGRNIDTYAVPNPSDASRMTNRTTFRERWVSQDWVYFSRFERLGDQFNQDEDIVTTINERWYKKSESEIDFNK